MSVKEYITVQAGSPQVRIAVSTDADAITYYYYTIDILRDDLAGAVNEIDYSKINQIRTKQNVETIHEGDLVISLMSATAAIAAKRSEGFLITQNFAKLTPEPCLDKGYLLFLLNEDKKIRNQLFTEGIGIKKIAIQQLATLQLGSLPSLEQQRMIGEAYLNVKHLSQLRRQSLEQRELYAVEGLKRISRELH